jgi:hypothetical protein
MTLGYGLLRTSRLVSDDFRPRGSYPLFLARALRRGDAA